MNTRNKNIEHNKIYFTRYVPSGDLEEIYLEYYGEKKITKEEIEVCSTIMLLGWIGEKIAGAKLFPKYAKTSPFLMEDLHTYFQGNQGLLVNSVKNFASFILNISFQGILSCQNCKILLNLFPCYVAKCY